MGVNYEATGLEVIGANDKQRLVPAVLPPFQSLLLLPFFLSLSLSHSVSIVISLSSLFSPELALYFQGKFLIHPPPPPPPLIPLAATPPPRPPSGSLLLVVELFHSTLPINLKEREPRAFFFSRPERSPRFRSPSCMCI